MLDVFGDDCCEMTRDNILNRSPHKAHLDVCMYAQTLVVRDAV